MRLSSTLILMSLLGVSTASLAAEPASTPSLTKAEAFTLEATAYFRYAYMIQDAAVEGDGEKEPHDNTFELMRFYFGAKAQLNSWLSVRYTADVGPESSAKVDAGGASVEIPGSQRYDLYTKFAWLQADLTSDLSLRFGVVDNPYNDLTDKFWNYRYTFKNVGDEEKLWEGADLGFYLRYSLPASFGDVSLGLANGSGYKTYADKDENKDLWLVANLTPFKSMGGILGNFKVGAYLDYVLPLEDDGLERLFFSGFLGYQDDLLTLGYQFLADDVTAAGQDESISGMGHGLYLRVDSPWKVGLLGRFAIYDKDTDDDTVATKYQALAGLSYAPAKLFQFSASGLATWYSEVDGVEKETEVKFLLSTQFQY